MTVVERLAEGLRAFPPAALEPPPDGRLGAVLALLEPLGQDDAKLVYTRRQAHLSSHPGQISFPGGRIDPGESPEQAALREGHEEVALDPSTVEVVGRLPSFYIPPSRYWLQTVLGHWRAPHPLHPAEAEVERILHVPLSALREPQRWRAVPLSVGGATWAWDLSDLDPSVPEGLLLWGATAIVTAVLLGVLDPDWSHGTQPQDLTPDREVRPWEDRDVAPAPVRPPLLRACPRSRSRKPASPSEPPSTRSPRPCAAWTPSVSWSWPGRVRRARSAAPSPTSWGPRAPQSWCSAPATIRRRTSGGRPS